MPYWLQSQLNACVTKDSRQHSTGVDKSHRPQNSNCPKRPAACGAEASRRRRHGGMIHCGLLLILHMFLLGSFLSSVYLPLSSRFSFPVHLSSQNLSSVSFRGPKGRRGFLKHNLFLKMHVFSGFNIVSMV